MNLLQMTSRISAVLLFLAAGGCQKAAPPAPIDVLPQEFARAKQQARKIVSAEPSSFDAVARHLDPGGSAYLYLSTESFIKQASAKVGAVTPLLMSAAKLSGADKDKAEAAWKSLARIGAKSGLNEITGFGASSIALEPGYYQTKWMLHHYEGKGNGVLWKLSGSAASALDIISYLPANTAMAGSGGFTLEPVWQAFNQEAAANPDLRAQLDVITQQFVKTSGLKIDHLLASVGPNYSFILTLDEARKTTLPGGPGGQPITVPEPAVALLIQVQDPALLTRLDQELTKVPGLVNADQPDVKIRVIPVPVPMPFIRPAVAWKKDLLIISSNEALVREILEVKAGKKSGIAASAEFRKSIAGMPTAASQFQFVTPLLQKTVMDLRTTMMQKDAALDPAAQQMLLQLFGATDPHWSCSMVENTPEGMLGTVHGTGGASQVIAVGAVAPVALLSAIAVPNFLRARKRSQATRVLQDLRILDAALDQRAIEHNLLSGTVVEFKDLQPYMKTGSALYNSNNKDMLGNAYNGGEPYKVDSIPKVSPATFEALSDVTDAVFWSPYK